jgi:hypothetical protein
MKRKGISKQTIARYMAAFIEIKAALDSNPKAQTTPIARQFKIGAHPITMLKKLGVIEHKKGGHKRWVGNEPNVAMVIQIAEAVHNYHAELRSRKSKGEMFTKIKKQPQIAPIIVDSSSHDKWMRLVDEQKAEKSDVLIRNEQPFDQSMVSEFIQHDEKPKVKHGELKSSKPKPRTFEVKIFGIRLFTINY